MARSGISSRLTAHGTRPKRRRRVASTAVEKTGRGSAAARWGRAVHEEPRADACTDRSVVRADPSFSHIWAGNGSIGLHLSVYVGPLGWVSTFSYLCGRVRTRAGRMDRPARDGPNNVGEIGLPSCPASADRLIPSVVTRFVLAGFTFLSQ
jgi:hypothetical protein